MSLAVQNGWPIAAGRGQITPNVTAPTQGGGGVVVPGQPPPAITSASSAAPVENVPFAFNLTASEPVVWSITGGADASLFDLSESTIGAVAFDFEVPADAGANGTYDVVLRATSTATGLYAEQAFSVTPTDVATAAITDLTSPAQSNSSITLAFTSVSDATSYQYRLGGGSAQTLPGDRIIVGLAANTSYSVQVRAIGPEGTGAWSNTLTQSTNNATPTATSMTFQTSAISNAATLALPGTIQVGDVLVLADLAEGSATPTQVIPTGWTSLSTITSGVRRQSMAAKIAQAGDAGSTITGINGNSSNQKALAVFRPNIAATALNVRSVFGGQGTNADPTAQTVASGSGVAPLIVLGAYGSNGAISPRSLTISGTEAKDGEVANSQGNLQLYLAYKIFNSSPANAVIDMGDHGTNFLQSGSLEVT